MAHDLFDEERICEACWCTKGHACLLSCCNIVKIAELVGQKCNVNPSFLVEMKLMIVMCALMSFNAMTVACENHQWKGHKILCCKNGTMFVIGGQQVWVKERPVFCQASNNSVEEKTSAVRVIGIIVALIGTVFSVCQCIYCTLGMKLIRNPVENQGA